VSRPDELADAFAAMSKARVNAVLALADPMTLAQRVRLAELAMQHSLPSMNGLTAYTEAGGLASYWPDSTEMFRRAADFVQRILGGARPSDLPIEQPTKFEMVVNLKTAKVLGLKFSAAILARADRVIE
jgi:putative ABC transport system substrate-binding protein